MYRYQQGWARYERIVALHDHVWSQRAGRAIHIEDGPEGLAAVLLVGRHRLGNRLLDEAVTGVLSLSAGVVFLPGGVVPDPLHLGGWLVTAANLPEISLTPRPAPWR
jgi:hypothetical protein